MSRETRAAQPQCQAPRGLWAAGVRISGSFEAPTKPRARTASLSSLRRPRDPSGKAVREDLLLRAGHTGLWGWPHSLAPCLLGSWRPQPQELHPGARKQAQSTQLRALRHSGWVVLLPQRRVRVLTPMSVPPASDRSLQRCQVRQGGPQMGPLQGRVSLQGGRFRHSEPGPCDDGGRGAVRRP